MIGVQITGTSEAGAWLRQYRSAQDKATRTALRKAGQVLGRAEKRALGRPITAHRHALSGSRDRAPGTLYRSIRNGRPRLIGPGRYSMSVGPGQAARLYRSVQEGRRPYVAPAVRETGPGLRTVFEAEWAKASAK